ncbi:MAG: hypothetical protein ACOCXA_01885, partial [Planctomycetota bacterium]
MATTRDTGPALQRLAGSLGSDIDAHLDWLRGTMDRLQERLDRGVAEQVPEWTQQRLADMLARLRHAELQLLQARDRLSLAPLMHFAAADDCDVSGLLRHLLPHQLIHRVLAEAAPR